MSNWNKVFKPIVVLCVICIVITGALAVTNNATAPIIAQQIIQAQEEARKQLLPDADAFTKIENIQVENVGDIYVADNGVGTVITCYGKGYGGTVTVMVAFNPDDTINQIKITDQAETAGLGTKIVTEESFLSSFVARPAESFTITDINAISGATISSRAVTTAVNAAIDAYNQIV